MQQSAFPIPLYRGGVVVGAVYNIVMLVFMAMYPYTVSGVSQFDAATNIVNQNLSFILSGIHAFLLILDAIKIALFRFKFAQLFLNYFCFITAIACLVLEAIIASDPKLVFYTVFAICDAIGVVWIIITLFIPPGFNRGCSELCSYMCCQCCEDSNTNIKASCMDCCYGDRELYQSYVNPQPNPNASMTSQRYVQQSTPQRQLQSNRIAYVE